MQAEQQSEREALIAAHNAIESLIAWDAKRDFPVPYKVRDPLHVALNLTRAALSHPSTPQGWKLVPVEPELVMLQAGRDLDLEGPGNGWLTNLPHYELRDIWQAMLNAAPLPPEQGGKG